MTVSRKKKIRPDTAALEHQRDETVAELARLQEALETSEVDPSVDEADPDVVEREKILALMEALELRLDEIKAALATAATGTYGICERCGQPIDPERLRIVPEATLCVSCKLLAEKERAANRSIGVPRIDEL
jgi:DnaK suppressor protein